MDISLFTGRGLSTNLVSLPSTLTCGNEICFMTERTGSQIQAAGISLLRRPAGHSHRNRVRNLVIWVGFGLEPHLFHIESSQLSWLRHLFQMPPKRLTSEGIPGLSNQKEAQDTLEGLCLPTDLGVPRVSPSRAGKGFCGGEVWESLLRPSNPVPDESGDKTRIYD